MEPTTTSHRYEIVHTRAGFLQSRWSTCCWSTTLFSVHGCGLVSSCATSTVGGSETSLTGNDVTLSSHQRYSSFLLSMPSVVLWLCALLLIVFLKSSSCKALSTPSLLVRQALVASQKASNDVNAAHEACRIWSKLLQPSSSDDWPLLHYALYAACLVRVGDDVTAVKVCAHNMTLPFANEEEGLVMSLRLTHARALQRLCRYDQAARAFGSIKNQTVAAATCSLRAGRVTDAQQWLSATAGEDNHEHVREMRGVLRYLGFPATHSSATERMDTRFSPVSGWVCCHGSNKGNRMRWELLEWIKVNVGPFDDPLLSLLDDKVELHRLLTRKSHPFWPWGTIVGETNDTLPSSLGTQESGIGMFIVKQRSGYGSHGNTIVQGWCKALALGASQEGEKLVQQVVPNPFLLNGRKFSLRVYVVLIPQAGTSESRVFISSLGLVKLAAERLVTEDAETPQMHMTNSGRGEYSSQYTFDYLRAHLPAHVSWEDFWGDIVNIVRSTLSTFYESTNNATDLPENLISYRRSLGALSLPKILGFDFVVSQEQNSLSPWLIEVNRFPGLEARGREDSTVKNSIVRSAWLQAADSTSLDHMRWIDQSFPDAPFMNGAHDSLQLVSLKPRTQGNDSKVPCSLR